MEYEIAVKTDVGRSRPSNQDSLFVRTADWQGKNYAFAVLCDGMGGLSDGDYASGTAIRALEQWFATDFAQWLNTGGREADLIPQWRAVLERTNGELVRYGRERSIELGTTATALLLGPERYAIAHVGDTRVYEIGSRLRQLSRDHTLAARKVEKGEMTPEEARHARENHVLTRCIGVYETVEPEFYFGDTRAEAVYLLCSDGFRNRLREEELESGFSPLLCGDAEKLLNACEHWLRVCLEREEDDNISVIAIRTLAQGKEPGKVSAVGDTVELV